MNVVKEISRIIDLELENGIYGGGKGSWHEKYRDSAWVYIGGMSYELSEGDVICVMSQWGEIDDINLVREKATNKSMGFAFVKYADQRSTILAVDNFNGITLLGRTLRCDHVDRYRLPKEVQKREQDLLEADPEAQVQIGPGHAYKAEDLANGFNITAGLDLWSSEDATRRAENQFDDAGGRVEKKRKQKDEKEKKAKKDKKDKEKKHKSDRFDTSALEDNAQSLIRGQGAATSSDADAPRARVEHRWDTGVALGSGAAASWRGSRDPALIASFEAERKRLENQDKAGARRDEFAGFGGMNRRR